MKSFEFDAEYIVKARMTVNAETAKDAFESVTNVFSIEELRQRADIIDFEPVEVQKITVLTDITYEEAEEIDEDAVFIEYKDGKIDFIGNFDLLKSA